MEEVRKIILHLGFALIHHKIMGNCFKLNDILIWLPVKNEQNENVDSMAVETEGSAYFEKFKKVCLNRGSRAAVIYGGQVFSYSKLLGFVESFSSGLKKLFPIKKGGRIMISLPPGLPYIISLLSMSRVGNIAIPLEPYVSEKTFLDTLSKINPSGIIASDGILNHYGKNISSEIFKIAVPKNSFISPRNRSKFSPGTPEIMNEGKKDGTNLFESLCYSEVTSPESIDPIIDIFIERLFKRDGQNSEIIGFTYECIDNSINFEESLFKGLEKNTKILSSCETYSVPAIVTCILLPLLKGYSVIIDSMENQKAIIKSTKWYNPEIIISENYLEENISAILKSGKEFHPKHLIMVQKKRNNEQILEIYNILKTRVAGVRLDERCGTPITVLESIEIKPDIQRDGRIFPGLILKKTNEEDKGSFLSVSGKQIATSEENLDSPENSQNDNSFLIQGLLPNENDVFIEDEIYKQDATKTYLNDFSGEIENELSRVMKDISAVLLSVESGISIKNILLIEGTSPKVWESKISEVMNYSFPRYIRKSEIQFVASIPRSMSGRPVLNLIFKEL